MNTKRSPRTASSVVVAALLASSAIACGGSAETSVEDGVVTETHDVETSDRAAYLTAVVRYPERHLLAGDVQHVEVMVVPRTNRPAAGTPISTRPVAQQPLRPELRRDIAPEAASAPVVRARPSVVAAASLDAARPRLDAAPTPTARPSVTVVAHVDAARATLDPSAVPETARAGLVAAKVPSWMQVDLRGPGAEKYRAVLLKQADEDEDRIDPGVLRRR